MEEETDKNGNLIQKLDNGDTKITTPEGRVFLVDKNGNTNINLPNIQKICLDNLVDLRSHVIMRNDNKTSHNIEFLDGGLVKIVFTTDGQLIEFSATNIRQTITKDNAIVIKSYSSN